MPQNGIIYLGKFDQCSDNILVSDPGYEFSLENYCQDAWELNILLTNVLKGEWHCWVKKDSLTNRNAELISIHVNQLNGDILKTDTTDFWTKIEDKVVCVDYGQAGIYDMTHFKDNNDVGEYEIFVDENSDQREAWYSMNCAVTQKLEHFAGTIPYGVVSSSGYGDGMYDLFVARKNDKVVGIKIVFIDDKQRKLYEPLLQDEENEEFSEEYIENQ